MPRRKPRRQWSGHICSSNKLKHSESLPKIRCCCSRSSTASGLRTIAAGNGDVMRALADQFLALAEKQGATVPLLLGHRMVGTLCCIRETLPKARAHFDRAIALYDPVVHRPLATRFGQDVRMASLLRRSWVLWSLGYPEAALADADHSLTDAREIGHAATLMFALTGPCWTNVVCGNYAVANALADELVAFADEKGAFFWKAIGKLTQGWLMVETGNASGAVQVMPAGIAVQRSAGSAVHMPLWLSGLARAYAGVGQFDEAWHYVAEAFTVMERTKEKWCDAQINNVAGEIALLSLEPDTAKAEVYFERALAVARSQQAKSFELRAATSIARLWRDQGKPQQARELLAPVYGWFTEGFETLDLKEAKALLDALRA